LLSHNASIYRHFMAAVPLVVNIGGCQTPAHSTMVAANL